MGFSVLQADDGAKTSGPEPKREAEQVHKKKVIISRAPTALTSSSLPTGSLDSQTSNEAESSRDSKEKNDRK